MEPTCDLNFLSSDILNSLGITTLEVIASIEKLLLGQKHGKVWNAPKAVLMPPGDRFMMATLTCADDPRFMAVKSLFLSPHNAEQGLESIQSVVTLMDSRTGLPRAVIDGNWITGIRTAGLSAVAATRLARPDSSSIAFVGCGVQARSHLRAMADLFPIQEVRAFGRGHKSRDSLCQLALEMGLESIQCESAQSAISMADIVVTSISMTPKPEPFLDANWLKPGAFAAIADQAIPWIPSSLQAFDQIVIDDLAQERTMVNPMFDLNQINGDLTTLVEGETEGRTSPDQRTAFVFRGLGIGDLAVAALAYQKSQA